MIRKYVYAFVISLIVYTTGSSASGFKIDVKDAVTLNGIKYWYVQNKELPIVSLSIAFKKAGYAYDPQGKQGIASLITSVITEDLRGPGQLPMKLKLAYDGVDITFSVDRENFYVHLKTLSENLDIALSHLYYCLTESVVFTDALDRIKGQQRATLKRLSSYPDLVAAYGLNKMLFGNHPYSYNKYGTEETINNVDVHDIANYIKNKFNTNQMVIGVTGNFEVEALSKAIDHCFSELNVNVVEMESTDIDQAVFKNNLKGYIYMDTPQSVIMIAQSGISYGHPDYYAVYLLNHIIGGLPLNSILMKKLRDNLGITYRIYSYLSNDNHCDEWISVLYTDDSTVDKGVSVLLDTIRDIKKNGVNKDMFNMAKSSITNAFVFSLLNADNTAKLLMNTQLRGLDVNYLNKRNSYFDAVTLNDVNRVAKSFLSNELSIIEVGRNNHFKGKVIN
ncbi:M16 family metallopeptidase [Candidatus Neoehrlichia procyonis]|uniref:Peptidase M16 inactive domain protein n=1 Tax=Candidatus Neoehrlichia procyonis str. RAC413 TaxID=1359163 RepID=A0A0F3NP47_9RICK|nr:pitrilysin family protein [Candidatus Neoehrlichia lotoris]KJV69477.1 peptidase M16 inactive domain protein [Candidatus Neoehrlichia lotoris str. RAC413]